MTRHKAREAALRALFAVDMGKIGPEIALENVLEDLAVGEAGERFATELVNGTLEYMGAIDEMIGRYAVGWSLERMGNIDRNVLRLALYEILYRDDIPAGVSANEAVRLAKAYGDTDSSKYVNGILGKVLRTLAPEQEAVQSTVSPRSDAPIRGDKG